MKRSHVLLHRTTLFSNEKNSFNNYLFLKRTMFQVIPVVNAISARNYKCSPRSRRLGVLLEVENVNTWMFVLWKARINAMWIQIRVQPLRLIQLHVRRSRVKLGRAPYQAYSLVRYTCVFHACIHMTGIWGGFRTTVSVRERFSRPSRIEPTCLLTGERWETSRCHVASWHCVDQGDPFHRICKKSFPVAYVSITAAMERNAHGDNSCRDTQIFLHVFCKLSNDCKRNNEVILPGNSAPETFHLLRCPEYTICRILLTAIKAVAGDP